MITTKLEKDKTTITIPRRMRKKELEKAVSYLSFLEITPKKTVSKKQIQELADEINLAAWERFKKAKGIK